VVSIHAPGNTQPATLQVGLSSGTSALGGRRASAASLAYRSDPRSAVRTQQHPEPHSDRIGRSITARPTIQKSRFVISVSTFIHAFKSQFRTS